MARPSKTPDPLIVERNDTIIALAKRGKSADDIAYEVAGVTTSIVKRVIADARHSGVALPYFPRGRKPGAATRKVGITLNQQQMTRLREYAATRNQTPADCASLILQTVVNDDLFNAVVGDLEAG